MHFIPPFGNSSINPLLCTSILACKKIMIAFFPKTSIISSPHILDNLEALHKFLSTVKISSQAIQQMWGSKSGAGADPHLFYTWWSLTYMLSSATLTLNLRIILFYSFSDVSSFCTACVYNDCHQKNQSRHSKMVLTSNIADAYNTFSSSWFSFSFSLSPMTMYLMNLTMKVLGPGSHPVHALFSFFSKNSVGSVGSSKYLDSVSSSKSVGCVNISRYVGPVSEIFSFGRVSWIFSVGRVIWILKVGRIR